VGRRLGVAPSAGRPWLISGSRSATSSSPPAGRRPPHSPAKRWLPIRSKLIHCRWSGEGTWIPFGDRRPDVGYENHTSHPAPGQLLIYTGDLSECEILFPYGACAFNSKLGQLAGNHFATVVGGAEHLPELGRRVLWGGAQDIEIDEVSG